MPRPFDGLFPNAAALRNVGICPFCGESVDVAIFKDDLSRKEFNISGLCQDCQDETFG